MALSSWDVARARMGLFAEIMPRAVRSAKVASHGDDVRGIPPSLVRPRSVGESALDEFFVAVNSVVRDVSNIDELADDVGRCEAAADELTALGIEGVNPPQPAPRIVAQTRKRWGPTIYQSIDFAAEAQLPGALAQYGPDLGDVFNARVLAGGGAGRRWLIWVHGAGQGRSHDMFSFRAAHLHTQLGYNVVMPVLPAHGARSHPGIDYPSFDPLMNVAVTSRAITDLRALVSWISEQDPLDITIAGTSLGGPLAAVASGLESRIGSVLAVVPMLGVHSTLAHHLDRAGERGRTAAALLRTPAVQAVSSVVDPLAILPQAPPDRRMVIAALNDRVTWVTAAQRLHDFWGGRIHWYPGGHIAHVFSGHVRRATDEFLSTTAG